MVHAKVNCNMLHVTSCKLLVASCMVGFSQQVFKKLSAEDAKQLLWYCCFKVQKGEQVKSLMSTIELLKACFGPPAEYDAERVLVHFGPPFVLNRGENMCSYYSSVVKFGVSPTIPSVPKISANIIPSTSSNHESKFNVALYGLEECSLGLSGSSRLESDLTNILKIYLHMEVVC